MNRVRVQMKTLVSNLALLIMLAMSFGSCLDVPDYPDEPLIEFVSVSKDTMQQGFFQEDSLIVKFTFQDGDGDLGRSAQGEANNIFFIDERTGTIDNTFAIPDIPQEGAENGVEGEVRIVLFSTCCIIPGIDPCVPDSSFPYDTVQYRIYIKDKAGHQSNEILTTPIILRCD